MVSRKRSWSDWVPEPPFEFRFRLPWLDYDAQGALGSRVCYCDMKAIDFAFVDGEAETLYLMEVKSAEWFREVSGNPQAWEEKACDLFRCYLDSLSVLTRAAESEYGWVRQAAKDYRVKLILFCAPRSRDHAVPQGLGEILRKRMKRKLKALDIDSDILVETFDSLAFPERRTTLPFEARQLGNVAR